MLYAQVDKKRWDDIPNEWDEVRDMFQYLHKMIYDYQVSFEARMFSTPDTPMYRCTLIKWVGNRVTRDMKREVLLETSDPDQMKAALFMLINEAEVQAKAAKNQVSMVP
jgi:hypothetical protein